MTHGALYPQTMASHGPSRSLEAYLAELVERFDALPETHYAARGKLAAKIRAVKAAIEEGAKL